MFKKSKKTFRPFSPVVGKEFFILKFTTTIFFEQTYLIKDNSIAIILFEQTAEKLQCLMVAKAGFDMSFEEFRERCQVAWKEKYKYIQFNRIDNEEKNILLKDGEKNIKFRKL